MTFDEFSIANSLENLGEKECINAVAYYLHVSGTRSEFNMNDINPILCQDSIPKKNTTRGKTHMEISPFFMKASNQMFKLSKKGIAAFSAKYKYDLGLDPLGTAVAQLTPFSYLTKDQISTAVEMSKLYAVIYCFENLTRNYINAKMTAHFGPNWWDQSGKLNANEKSQWNSRLEKEQKYRWHQTRGDSTPLYYLDWSNLISIIKRNFDLVFKSDLHVISFVDSRLGEIERTRHIVAHNGIADTSDLINRLSLYYQDWVKAITPKTPQ